MIDIMAFREFYQGWEIDEIRWIHGKDNSANAMTKVSLNLVSKRLILTNKATIGLERWVKQ